MSSRSFGPLLREWRLARRMSQEKLGAEAEVSTRHISFLENDKAQPSRTMVLVLASALDLPLRDRNSMLQAAGLVAAYRESGFESEEDNAMRKTLELILQHHDPIPALGLTPVGDVVQMNAAAVRIFSHFLAGSPEPIVLRNALHALFHPCGLRPCIANWDDVAHMVIERIHLDILAEPDPRPLRELLAALLAYPDVPVRFGTADVAARPEICIPVHLRRDGLELRLFTTLTTIGTPIDISAEELRIEAYYPADDRTAQWLRQGD